MKPQLSLLFLVGRIFSPVYRLAMLLRAFLYRKNILLKTQRLSVPVISVGNLTLGGTGKTPMVRYVAKLLLLRGLRPAIVSRGYGGKAAAPVNIVSAGNGLRVLGELGQEDQDWLVQSFRQLSNTVDVVLVDAIAGVASNVLPLSLASQEIVIVVSQHPSSIKDAYALIKVLNQNFAIHRFHILASKVKNEQEARGLYDNMADVAVRFLDVSLDFMGYVPLDEKLRQASRICRPVVEAFPIAESAKALRGLAETMEQWPQPSGEDGRLEAFMLRLIQRSRMAAESFRL